MISLDISVYLEQKIIDVSQDMGTTKMRLSLMPSIFILNILKTPLQMMKQVIYQPPIYKRLQRLKS